MACRFNSQSTNRRLSHHHAAATAVLPWKSFQMNPSISGLTPIKVRGKKQSLSSVLDSYPGPNHDGERSPSIGRTSNLPSLPPAKRSRRDAPASSPTTSPPSASTIERLPAEILEIIFFHCLNISLPQASPIIGHALASEHVKKRLVLLVLSSGNDAPPFTLRNIVPTLKEQAELQSAILQTRWMTLAFLQGIIPDYIVTTIIRELSQRSLLWLGTEAINNETGFKIREFLKHQLFSYTSESGLPCFVETAWLVEGRDGRKVICLGIGLRDGLVTLRTLRKYGPHFRNDIFTSELSCSKWRILCGVEGCQIPEKLLHSPWTENKCEMLEIVIRGNATVDWIGSTSGEIAERGLLEAILENNIRAIRALLPRRANHIDGQANHLCLFPEEINNWQLCGRMAYRDLPVRKGVGVIPGPEHLQMARKLGNGHNDILEALSAATERPNSNI